MSHRATAHGIALLIASVGALALPANGLAASGGSGLAPASPAPTATEAPLASPNSVVSASGDGMTIASRAAAVLRGALTISGQVSSSHAGQTVEIERMGHQTRWSWTATTRAVIGSDGSFSAVWRVNHIGRFQLRAVIASGSAASAAAASPAVTITVYRPALATIFGPGLYGNGTACGQTLTHRTLGVANRTLPCGTQVALMYHGRTLVVPVIDRGPYANGADWDLTAATAKRLGMTSTATIDAVSLPARS